MLVMNSPRISLLRNNGIFTGRRYGLLWILLSGTSVFLQLEGRQYPITLAIKFYILSKTDSFDSSKEDGMVLDDDPSVQRHMVTFVPKNLIGRTFLKESEEFRQHFRARVVCAVLDIEDDMKTDPQYMKFIFKVPNSKLAEMFT
jgi:hypothetical protein